MIPSEDDIRKTSVFVLLMLRAHVDAYFAAVLTGVIAHAYAYTLVTTSL